MADEEKVEGEAAAAADAFTLKVDPPADPVNSAKTNGSLVRFVGRNRIQDGFLHALEYFLFPPLGVYNLIVARMARASWNDTFYDLFCIGNRPEGTGELVTAVVSRAVRCVSALFCRNAPHSSTHSQTPQQPREAEKTTSTPSPL